MWVKSFSLPSVVFSFVLLPCLFFLEALKGIDYGEAEHFFFNPNYCNAFYSSLFTCLFWAVRKNTYVLTFSWRDLALVSTMDCFLEFWKTYSQLFKCKRLPVSLQLHQLAHGCLTICVIQNSFWILFEQPLPVFSQLLPGSFFIQAHLMRKSGYFVCSLSVLDHLHSVFWLIPDGLWDI